MSSKGVAAEGPAGGEGVMVGVNEAPGASGLPGHLLWAVRGPCMYVLTLSSHGLGGGAHCCPHSIDVEADA